MATVVPAPPTAGNAPNHPHRQRPRWRRPRRGGGQGASREEVPPTDQLPGAGSGAQHSGDSLLMMRPASVAPRSQPQSTEPSSADVSAAENGAPRGPKNQRGRRGGIQDRSRGGAIAQETSDPQHDQGPRRTRGGGTRINTGRQFGGQLTAKETETQSRSSTVLQADAPEFQPGRQHTQRPTVNGTLKALAEAPSRNTGRNPRARRDSKSSAPDIATRIHEDISRGLYECPICTSEVGRRSQVWSCKTCWTVFHLSCIKKWSKNEGSTHAQQQAPNGELPPPRQWRCPGCNLPKETMPASYSCWCEKEIDPRPISGIPPHSCGQTCGKHRILPKSCPHPCELLCHAGPCPPCTHIGPTQSCFCGKQSATRRCADTNYDDGWRCRQICGDTMPCGEHTCQKECHEGLCGACEVEVDARCYCGKVEKPILCCDRGDEKESKRASCSDIGARVIEGWTGIIDCGGLCGREFDCGKHKCEKPCHVQKAEPEHCPRSPNVVSRCPCGKTPLVEIADKQRQTCEDPIPNCKKECSKPLSCGHACQQICHSGNCLPCLRTVSISCRCGRTNSSAICHQGNEEPPQCMRTCRVTLNCGRHECGERCCTGERKATERQSSKRKLRPLGSAPRAADEGFEAEHICTRACGRPLKCGNHTCPELCHRGPCGTCREAIFDELSCDCGRTVLQPPLPCGTNPPPCRFECERPKSCGHPQVSHNCHGADESCPKCPFLVQKPCACGKKTLKNQQCWLPEVHCGEICGRKLKCGSHTCRKQCHKPGECEDKGKACHQACGKAKKTCGHPCEEQCHAPYPCKEERPCPHKLLITCDCQHLKQEVKCHASKSSDGNCKKSLKCDDECARLERNRKLALALNIDTETHKDDHIPYSSDTLSMYAENVKWSQTQEREFRVFANDDDERRLRFKPMTSHQRAFLHLLAEDFGLDSESMDPEPYRHVAIFKTPRYVSAPNKTLAECLRLRPQPVTASEPPKHILTNSAVAANTNVDPYNALLLLNPRFGLTHSDLSTTLLPIQHQAAGITIDTTFLPNGNEIVLKARLTNNLSTQLPDQDLTSILRTLKPKLKRAVIEKGLANEILLCRISLSTSTDLPRILRREGDGSDLNSDIATANGNGNGSGGGWSQVAAGAGVKKMIATGKGAVGGKSSFTVLGSRVREKERKEREEMEKASFVVDDWEVESRREEAVAVEKGKDKEKEKGVDVEEEGVDEGKEGGL
ncbi:MAG: hypothetical protein M1812_005739 [Candelaria pacifica]|nr:MAG: hypothetical protein M1812_005739 [Candelaria pacifica]